VVPAKHLVVFVKDPRLGRVKTRLARDIGPVAARAFYWRTTERILRRLRGSGRWRLWLAITPDAAVDARRVWPPGWRRIAQGPGGLGERMDRIMRVLPVGPVVIVGSDIPDIGAHHVERAFHALGGHDAVFGPAADGGYWLVGLRRSPRILDIFRGVRWSTAFALVDTRANLGSARVALLETLDDIDDGADWNRRRRRGDGLASAKRDMKAQ
jgi:rSAM/selenodomain-associated transferase 1